MSDCAADRRPGTIGNMRRAPLIIAAAVAALALPVAASAARADDDEVRVRGTCSAGSTSSLRVRADDGALRVELRIDARRRGGTWSVILLHERRIVYRGKLAASGGGSLRLRRGLPDLFGTDTIVARASGPLRETCRASASL